MTQVRVKGFVVGYDEKAGEILWTVRVKDSQSIHHGKKFQVESLRDGAMLTKPGVDVTFCIKSVQVGSEEVLKAVDVSLGHVMPSDENVEATEETPRLKVLVTVMDGQYHVAFAHFRGLAEARQAYQGTDEQVVELYDFTPENLEGLALLEAITVTDGVCDTLEELLVAVFQLGQKHSH